MINKSNQFRVGKWTVDPELGKVRSDDSEISLQPQVMQLLVFLSRHPGEVISIDDMIEEVWQGKPMTSGSVYNALNTLRKAFGDESAGSQYIETLPRRGYRLIADVSAVDSTSENKPEPSMHLPARGQPGRAAIVGLATLVVLAVSLYWVGERLSPEIEPRSTAKDAPEKSIAVLPFADMSPEGDHQYFADGVSEEILNVIARYPDLKVVGRTSSFSFRGKNQDLRETARQLGVSHILEGSVRLQHDQIRVTAQLIKAEDGYHLWSESFDANVSDVFSVQDQIAGKVAAHLQSTLLEQTGLDASNKRFIPGLDAYDLFLLARHRVGSAGVGIGREALEEAIEYLEQATELQPAYADAHAELAFARISLWRYFRSATNSNTMHLDGPALRHANDALALDPDHAGALTSAGIVYYVNAHGVQVQSNIEKAENLLGRALDINPNSSRALVWTSGLMILQKESLLNIVQTLRRAVELDPLWPFASEWYFRWMRLVPQFREEKWQLVQSFRARGPDFSERADLLEARAWDIEGSLAKAIGVLESLAPNDGVAADLNFMYWQLGQFDKVGMDFITRWQVTIPGRDGAVSKMNEDCPTQSNMPVTVGSEEYTVWRFKNCLAARLLLGQLEETTDYLEWTIAGDVLSFAKAQYPTGANFFLYELLAGYLLMQGDREAASQVAELMRPKLDSYTENGSIKDPNSLIGWAAYYAITGRDQLAVDAFSETLEAGNLDFSFFLYPAFHYLRDDIRFTSLKSRWLELTNEERAQLGLEPLELNLDTSPGQLPFIYEH